MSQFVAISKFRVANEMSEQVRAAFEARPHKVDSAPGFVRMDVLSPVDDNDEFWLVTVWTDEESFRSWHASHLYRESHHAIPKGLKLDARATELRTFRTIAT